MKMMGCFFTALAPAAYNACATGQPPTGRPARAGSRLALASLRGVAGHSRSSRKGRHDSRTLHGAALPAARKEYRHGVDTRQGQQCRPQINHFPVHEIQSAARATSRRGRFLRALDVAPHQATAGNHACRMSRNAGGIRAKKRGSRLAHLLPQNMKNNIPH